MVFYEDVFPFSTSKLDPQENQKQSNTGSSHWVEELEDKGTHQPNDETGPDQLGDEHEDRGSPPMEREIILGRKVSSRNGSKTEGSPRTQNDVPGEDCESPIGHAPKMGRDTQQFALLMEARNVWQQPDLPSSQGQADDHLGLNSRHA